MILSRAVTPQLRPVSETSLAYFVYGRNEQRGQEGRHRMGCLHRFQFADPLRESILQLVVRSVHDVHDLGHERSISGFS